MALCKSTWSSSKLKEKAICAYLIPIFLLVFFTDTTSDLYSNSGYKTAVPFGFTTSQYSIEYLLEQYWLNIHTIVSRTTFAYNSK